MDILINGKPIEGFDFHEEITIAELIQKLRLFFHSQKKSVLEIILDGNPLIDPISSEIALSNSNTFKQLECQVEAEVGSENSGEMIREAAGDGPVIIPHVVEELTKIVGNLRVGEVGKAMDGLVQFIEGLEWVCTVSDNLELGFKEKLIECELGKGREEIANQLKSRVNELFEGQKNQDWVGIADILEYEIQPLLVRFQELLAELSKP